MNKPNPTITEAAKEFNISYEPVIDFLKQKSFDTTVLQPDSTLTEEMYAALESGFVKDLAARRIQQCLEIHDTYLDIGNCGLTDESFKEGNEIDRLLKQCTHVETLILSSKWYDYEKREWITSKNTKDPNILSLLPNAVSFCKALKKLVCTGGANPEQLSWKIRDITLLAQLSFITYLDLSYNQLTEIKGLESLTALEVLDLSSNQLAEIKGLESLGALNKLDLSYNRITEIKGLESLTALKVLRLTGNRITEIKGLESLTALEVLYLFSNQLAEIKGLESLCALNELNLSSNQLTEIKGLELLRALNELDLSYNQLAEIKGLESLSALNGLNLSSNQLTEIKGLESLRALNELNLSYNQLTEIKGLESLSALQVLNLFSNQLTEIKGLESLTALEVLYLFSNQLTEIKGLESLGALNELYLSSNQLTEIKGLELLRALNNLDLSSNKLTEIKGLESLSALQVLNLSSNKLTEIKGLESLKALDKLDLSYNQITEIKDLEFLLGNSASVYLNLYGNPLIEKYHIKLERDENHIHFIKDLLGRQKSVNKQILAYPLKVLMLGNHATGKSSLVNYLIDIQLEGSTHILRIANYRLRNSYNQTTIPDVIFYDFGGQDFYHGLYQAFISPGALQIIVFDEKKDKNAPATDSDGKPITNYNRQYWLGQKSYKETENKKPDPFIIVQTFADGPDAKEALPIDYKVYKGHKKSFFLSFSPEIKEEHNEDELFYKMEREYFKSYFDYEVTKLLKEDTGEEADWYIKFLEFVINKKDKDYKPDPLKDILIHYGNKELNEEVKLQSLQTNLITLHRHGLVLYYLTEELKDIVWLNPEALVKHIQDTVLSKPIITNNQPGIVAKKEFEQLTDERIRQLLILQKVVFLHQPNRAKPEEGEYIIPNYLPLANENDADYQLFTFGLGKPNFIIKFDDFIPFGFINQMISFYGQQLDAKKFWRNQLLFTLHREARVMIQIDFEQLKIKVYFQLLKSSNTSEMLIAEYLFFSILGLYWSYLENISLFTYSEFIEYKKPELKKNSIDLSEDSNLEKKYLAWDALQQKDDYIPSDAYVSVDDERFVSYKELLSLGKERYRINSYSIKYGRINKEDVKEMPVSLFSFIKKTAVMKNVFISYSHNDIQYRQELQQFLVNLVRDGLIEIWQDGLIQAGEDWDKKIKEGLEKADICILLLSQSFIVSNYVHEVEFKNIMEGRKSGTSRIIPVLIRECDWKNWKVYPQNVLDEMHNEGKDYKIGSFQFLPLDENKRVKAINKWIHEEDAWLQVADAVRDFCKL
jgi:internalin A